MTKEVVKHRKDEKKKPTLTAKEKKAKKQEKKQSKQIYKVVRPSRPESNSSVYFHQTQAETA